MTLNNDSIDAVGLIFSSRERGSRIMRERPAPDAKTWKLFVAACLLSFVSPALSLYVANGLGPAIFWMLLMLAAWLTSVAGARLTGRGLDGWWWALGCMLLGGGANVLLLGWLFDLDPRGGVVWGCILLGLLSLVYALSLTRAGLRRQERMRELRARGRRVSGVLEAVQYVGRVALGDVECEVTIDYSPQIGAQPLRRTARLRSPTAKVPLPGSPLWLYIDPDTPEGDDILIELDGSSTVEFVYMQTQPNSVFYVHDTDHYTLIPRMQGRRVEGVLESLQFLETWAGKDSWPKFWVTLSYTPEPGAEPLRRTAWMFTKAECVPLPGSPLWVYIDPAAPDSDNLLIELNLSAPIKFDLYAAKYKNPDNDYGCHGCGCP